MPVCVRLGEHEASVARDDGTEVVFDLARGTFDVLGPGGAAAVTGATARVVLAENESHSLVAGYSCHAEGAEISDALGRGMAVRVNCEPEGTGPELVVTVACYDETPGALIALECRNALGREIRVEALEVLAARSRDGAAVESFSKPSRARFYHTGLKMADSPFVDLAHPSKDLAEWARSSSTEHMGCLVDASRPGASLLLGFVTGARQPTRVEFGLDPGADHLDEFMALCELESRPLHDGGSVKSERLWVCPAGDPLDSMERYAELLGRSMGARRWREHPAGWCSWYYFGADVTQEDIRSNLRWLAENRERYPVKFIQIDDGFQKHWGDWLETSGRFPDGMRALAEEIRSFGFTPGIWVAPFVASSVSDVARLHPEWLVRDRSGEPVSPSGFGPERPWRALDGTHPEVQAHLEQVFRTITREWGYPYVKLDAMDVGAPTGAVFHDPAATRIEAYRRGFEAIRRGCGDDAFILGCNAPFAASVGIADGMRVSPDVSASWVARRGCSPRASLRNSIRRWFFHRSCWWNDPDCLVVRGSEGERANLALDEARTLTAGLGLTGGMMLLSDDMPKLTPERAALLDLLFPLVDDAARPLDLFKTDPPSVLALVVERGWEIWRVAQVINWADEPRPMALDLDLLGVEGSPARHHVFDLFEERYHGLGKGVVELGTVPPHGSRLVAARSDLGRPQVVSTSFHLTQGGQIASCEWREAARTLAVEFGELRARRGRVFVHVPESYVEPGLDKPTVGGTAKVHSSGLEGRILTVELDAAPGATLEIAFG